MSKCKRGISALTAGLLLAFGAAQSADANTVHDILIDGGEKAIDCSLPGCKGVLEDGSLSTSEAFAFDKPGNANETSITNLLNSTLDPNTNFSPGTRTNLGNGVLSSCSDTSCTFNSSAAFVALKIGNEIAFISNMTGGEVDLTFTKISGSGGLSNITEIGQATVIPVPAPLILLMSAVGGIGLLARRRRA